MSDELLLERADGVLRLTLNRPDVLNAVRPGDGGLFARALEEAVSDDDVRVVVLTGAGAAFCAGAELGPDGLARVDDAAMAGANRAIRAIISLDKPVVAAVNGPAAGYGTSLALACDLQVAHPSATFFPAFARLGLMPDGGASATLAASMGRARAMRALLLAEPISAQEAYEAGLVSHATSTPEEYEQVLHRVVDRLAHGAPLALAATKKAVNAATLPHLSDALEAERRGQTALLRTDDASEGMAAFLGGRRPRFTGS